MMNKLKIGLPLNPILRIKPLLVLITLCCANTSFGGKNHEIKASEIIKMVKKNKTVCIKDMTVTGDLDFTIIPGFQDTRGSNRAYVEAPIQFQNCNFSGKVLAHSENGNKQINCFFQKSLNFSKCVFKKEVNFNSSVFNLICSFSGSQFYDETSFENAIFQYEADFNKCIFAVKTFYQGSRFKSRAHFSEAIFNQNINFQGSDFYDFSNFRMCQFRENVEFSICTFFKDSSFNFLTINKKGIFSNCRFEGRLEFENIEAKTLEFEHSKFNDTAIINEINCETLTLDYAIFSTFSPVLKFRNNNIPTISKIGMKTPENNN